MEFKDFPKEYEDVFTSERTLKKCDINLVSTDKDIGIDEYMNNLNSTFNDFQSITYDFLVKIVWLFRRYCYKGTRRKHLGPNGIELDGSFAVFMRKYIGFDATFVTKSFTNMKAISYFDDFYPDFDISNPFEGKYEYPYKHMKLEALVLVSNMKERLDLLRVGEEKQMDYSEFFDYIINYINCYNDEHGDKYEFVFSRLCVPYIKKYEGKKIQTGDVSSRADRLLQKQRLSAKLTVTGDAGNRQSKRTEKSDRG